jgi:DNA-binding NarL/FixJ family response regulator
MKTPISVHITEDHQLYADGLTLVLQSFNELILTGISKNGAETFAVLRTQPPDILLLDINLPDIPGTEIIDFVVRNKIPTKIIIVSMHYEKTYINLARKRGANGYVPKNVDKVFLIEAIETVMQNGLYFKDLSDTTYQASKHNLSSRELEVLNLILRGNTSNEVAKLLYISLETVKTHRKNLYSKLQVSSQNGLMFRAQQLGLF